MIGGGVIGNTLDFESNIGGSYPPPWANFNWHVPDSARGLTVNQDYGGSKPSMPANRNEERINIMAKRGRKKKSQLIIEHEESQKRVTNQLENITLHSNLGKELKDIINILIVLDMQITDITDMFHTFISDVFRSTRT